MKVVPVDSYCDFPQAEVVTSEGDPYHCMLSFTDVQKNINKYYLMQIVQFNGKYYHYTRYGRIGNPGKTIHQAYQTLEPARLKFVQMFHKKTGTHWHKKQDFIRKKKRYFLLDQTSDLEPKVALEKVSVASTLGPLVLELLQLLSNVEMMTRAMQSFRIDTRQMPLGKLTLGQLQQAHQQLQKIEQYLKTQTEKKKELLTSVLSELTSLYYTYLPMSWGHKKPPLIQSHEQIQIGYDLLEELKNLVQGKLLTQQVAPEIHPLDSLYQALQTQIQAVEPDSTEGQMLFQYLVHSHAPTHPFTLQLVDIYRLHRTTEQEPFQKKAGQLKNLQLLIHGSRMCNWISILKSGFLLDPSRLGVLITGKMFGYGIYFSNSFSKSAQYCGVPKKGQGRICLLLATVALGQEMKLTEAAPTTTPKDLEKAHCHSVWGQGQMSPDGSENWHPDDLKLPVQVPNGVLSPVEKKSSLRYDEKVVYDTSQFRMEYLVVLDMKYT